MEETIEVQKEISFIHDSNPSGIKKRKPTQYVHNNKTQNPPSS